MIEKILAIAGTAAVLLTVSPAFAAEIQASAPADFYPGVSSYEPAFFGWVVGNDPYVHFQVSIKYPFLPFVACGANTTTAFIGYKSGLYVAYTGIYDLIWSRYSSPVISREQTPGFFFDFNRCFALPLTVTLGYFHDSNGQAIDTREEYVAMSDHPQDYISRGWDYLLLGGSYVLKLPWLDTMSERDYLRLPRTKLHGTIFNYQPNLDKSNMTVSAQGLWFLEKQGFGIAWREERVFWEDVLRQPKRSDYDGVRVRFMIQNAHYRVTETLRTGYTALNLSNDLSITFRVRKWLPVSVQWHAGYGPDLATYQVYSQRITLGFELYDYKEQ
jgi:outer membrane phospholipase A